MNKIITLISVLLINSLSLPINAQTKSINLTINNQKNENFYGFVNRGEKLAISQINNTFIKFPETQEISLQILGENQGKIAPIILIKVSKLQWQKEPQIEKYVKYIPESEILLGFVIPQIIVPQTQIKVVNSGFQEMAESHLE
ncbi:MAG TPA: hypothetical protein V6C58_06050, partial [Allocoleopsis sp.]